MAHGVRRIKELRGRCPRAGPRDRGVPRGTHGAAIRTGAADAVLTLHDITVSKLHEAVIAAARDLAQAAIEGVPEPQVVLDASARVRIMNNAFASLAGVRASEAWGRLRHKLRHRQPATPEFRKLVDEAQGRDVDNAVLEREIAGPGPLGLGGIGRLICVSGVREGTVVLTVQKAGDPGPGSGRGGDERAGTGEMP